MKEGGGPASKRVRSDVSQLRANGDWEEVIEILSRMVTSFAEVSNFIETQEDTLEGKNAAFLKYPTILTAVPLIRRFFAVVFEVSMDEFVHIAKSNHFQEVVKPLAGSEWDKAGLGDPELSRDVGKRIVEAFRAGRDLGIKEKPDVPVQDYETDD